MNGFIPRAPDAAYSPAMILMTRSERLELVEELRGMAAAAPTAKVRDALTKMADRYAARAADVGRLAAAALLAPAFSPPRSARRRAARALNRSSSR